MWNVIFFRDEAGAHEWVLGDHDRNKKGETKTFKSVTKT